MKRWLLLFLPFLLLVSCGAPSTPAPTATLIPSAAVLPTIASTVTPEASPTATKDPNAPQGFTRFENGNYLLDKKTDKGNTLTYTWDKERQAWYRQVFSGYLLDRAKELNNQGLPDEIMMNIYIDGALQDEATSFPTLIHPDNTDSANTIDFNNLYETLMTQAMVKRGVINNLTEDDKPHFDDHKLYLDFTTLAGSQREGFWPGATISIHIHGNYLELEKNMQSNGYGKTPIDTYFGKPNNFMVRILTQNGNTDIDIAPSLTSVKDWSDKLKIAILFYGQTAILSYSDLTTFPSGSGPNSVLPEIISVAKQYPFFIFGSPQ